MTSNVLIFEQFDDAATSAADIRVQQERAAEYAEGYAAGEAAALSRAMEQNQLLQAAAEAIHRELASFDDKAGAFLCGALVDAVKKVFPTLCEDYSANEAIAALSEVFVVDGQASLVISVPTEKLDIVRNAISSLPIAERATVEADDALSAYEIRAEWRHGGVSFNAENAIAQFIATLEKATGELKGEAGHD